MSDRLDEIERAFNWSRRLNEPEVQWLIAEVKRARERYSTRSQIMADAVTETQSLRVEVERLRGPAPGGGSPQQPQSPHAKGCAFWDKQVDDACDCGWQQKWDSLRAIEQRLADDYWQRDGERAYWASGTAIEDVRYLLGVARPGEDAPPSRTEGDREAIHGACNSLWYSLAKAEFKLSVEDWSAICCNFSALRTAVMSRGGPTPSREQPK